jgi:hypothetical protein
MTPIGRILDCEAKFFNSVAQSRGGVVKLFALTFLVVGSLIANQAFAGNISTQPLTREGCDKAAMAWDENGNVCTANSKKDSSSQPLTRLECI